MCLRRQPAVAAIAADSSAARDRGDDAIRSDSADSITKMSYIETAIGSDRDVTSSRHRRLLCRSTIEGIAKKTSSIARHRGDGSRLSRISTTRRAIALKEHSVDGIVCVMCVQAPTP